MLSKSYNFVVYAFSVKIVNYSWRNAAVIAALDGIR